MNSGLELLGDCWCSILTAGNQPALLGCLDAVGQADHAGAGTDGLEQRQAQFHPAGGELVQIESLAVKQMQEGVHAKLWGVQAAAAGWSRSTSGRKPRCQWRNASSRVALRT